MEDFSRKPVQKPGAHRCNQVMKRNVVGSGTDGHLMCVWTVPCAAFLSEMHLTLRRPQTDPDGQTLHKTADM